LEESINPTINVGPVTFDLTLLAMTLLTVFVTFGLVYWASRKMTIKPSRKQNALEYIYDFVIDFTKGNVGEHYMKNYSLFLFSLFLFVTVANNLGLMAKVQTTNGFNLWTSPTANLAFDLGFSLLVTVFCHVEGIRRQGIKGYLKGFVTPGIMTPMNILEEFTNFASLALRIYGNIFAGEVLAGLLLTWAHQAAYWYPIAFIMTGFSIFISCIQAYVFTMLTSMYLGKKINGEEE